jgi:3-hydroxyacyl-CoA dehydrogenase
MQINKVACVGAGLIGHGWATLFAWKGCDVTLQDLKEDTLKNALSQVRRNLQFLSEHELLGAESCEDCLGRIRTTTDLREALGEADYIQESVYESYKAKKEVFKLMDAAAPPHTILASSSSTLKMSVIQKATEKPDRCIVAHPWNSPHLMPLVEIILGRRTSAETKEATKEFMTKLGKVTVVQKKEVSGNALL